MVNFFDMRWSSAPLYHGAFRNSFSVVVVERTCNVTFCTAKKRKEESLKSNGQLAS